MKTRLGRLTWRRMPRHTGLARITQGERGWDLRLHCNGARDIGSVNPVTDQVGFGQLIGWMWCAVAYKDLGLPYHNSYSDGLIATADEAKAQCIAYVMQHLEG